MTKPIVIVLLLVILFPFRHHAQSAETIHLKACVELCLIYYADQSGSMDEAHNDICRWAKWATLVPPSDGAVSVGLYSFSDSLMQWLPPSSNKTLLRSSVDSMCARVPNSGTLSSSGLSSIQAVFKERRLSHPYEHQVLLMHSDYFIDNNDCDATAAVLQELIDEGVVVVLSVPLVYDSYVPMSPTPPEKSGAYNPDICDAYISRLQALGAISVRSNFSRFVTLLARLEAKRSCN